MQIEGLTGVFLLGCFGGSVLELLRWWKIREAGYFPEYARRPGYWLITGLMIAAGGVLSVLYGTTSRSALLPVDVGAATPAIIAAFSSGPIDRSTTSSMDRRLDNKEKYPVTRDRLRRSLSFQLS